MNYQFHLLTSDTFSSHLEAKPLPVDVNTNFARTTPVADFASMYNHQRIQEWLSLSQLLLRRQLQPGNAKNKSRFQLGSLPVELFLRYFNQFLYLGKYKTTQKSYIDNDCRMKALQHHFEYSIIRSYPPLIDDLWYIKEQELEKADGTIDKTINVVTKITFSIDSSTGVSYCKFTYQTSRFVDGSWMATL